jgi:hypothetical protein
MRKISKIISLLIVFMFILPIFSRIGLGYETNRNVQIDLEQQTNNDEIIGGIGVLGTYPYFSHPEIDSSTIDYQYSVIDVSNIYSYTSYSSDPISITNEQTEIVYNLDEFTRGANTQASIDFKFQFNFNYPMQGYDSFQISKGSEVGNYIHCDENFDIDITYTIDSDYDLISLIQGYFYKTYTECLRDDDSWSANLNQVVPVTIYVNGIIISTTTNYAQFYGVISSYASVSQSTTIRFVVDFSQSEFTKMPKDLFTIRFPYCPFLSLEIDDIEYIVDSIEYHDTSIVLELGSRSLLSGVIYLTYTLNIEDLEHFDENKDILISEQEIDLTAVREYAVALTSHLESVSYESIFASEYDIELNNELLTDTSKGNAQLIYYEYPASLIFDASESNIKFEFTITDFFSYDFELSVISNSYLRSILQTNTEHSLQLKQVDYLFTSEIKHSYVNNIDYLTEHIIYPDVNIIEDSSIKIEVLLDDSVYLPLAVGTFAEQTETSNYNYLTDASEISLNSIAYPASATITISDIWGYNDAVLNDVLSESQSFSESYNSDHLTPDAEVYPETIYNSGLMTGFVDANAANGVVATQGTYASRKTAWTISDAVRGISYIPTNTYASMPLNVRQEFWIYAVTAGRLALKIVMYDGSTQRITQLITGTGNALTFYICGSNTGNHDTSESYYNKWIRVVSITNCTSTTVKQIYTLYNSTGSQILTHEDNININNNKVWKMGICNGWGSGTNYADSFNAWSYFNYTQDLNINPINFHLIDESFNVEFSEITNTLYNISIVSDIDCDNTYQLRIYNYYTEEFEVIDEEFDEINFANLFAQDKIVILNVYSISYYNEISLSISGDSEIYYYESGEYNFLQELTIAEIGLTINDIEISELVYELELSESQNLVFNTESICYFNVQIDLTYQIANNFEQLTESMTSDDNVEFRYFYKADHDYNKWYVPKLDNLISYEFFDGLIELTTQSDANNIYFTRSLLMDDVIYADYVLDPNIIVSTTILENTGTYCDLQIDVTSDFVLENVEILVKDFNNYFEDWEEGITQFSLDKIIHFTVVNLNLINIFEIEATTTPPLVEFGDYSNSLEFIDENWDENIEFEVILDIPQYSEMFRLPTTTWEMDGVFYGSNSYAITDNVFICEGFNENTLSAYLHFYMNPIMSFVQIQSSNNITITINSELELDCYLVFHIDNLPSYNLNDDDVESLYSIEEQDFYYILVHLDAGINTFTYTFTSYNVINVLTYLIPIIIVIGLLGVGFWYKNRKNKKSNRDVKK